MKIEEAIVIAKHVYRAREIAGRYMDVPYHQDQLVDALLTLYAVTGEAPASKEDLRRVTNQLNAAKARLALYSKKFGKPEEQEGFSDIRDAE